MNQETIESAIRLLLTGLGEDLEREGIIETPKRAVFRTIGRHEIHEPGNC